MTDNERLREKIKHIHQKAYGTIACQAIDESIALVTDEAVKAIREHIKLADDGVRTSFDMGYESGCLGSIKAIRNKLAVTANSGE